MAWTRGPVVPIVPLTVVVALFVMRAAEVVLVVICTDGAPKIGAGLLIEAEMNAAEDTRIADVVGDLTERRGLADDAGHSLVYHRDRVAALTVGAAQDLGGPIAGAAVI